ncbi:type III-A CRISPR-associated RAMP protein Csm5, partial [bacterium]|nr:type III-A CRISPR-associated RAMP protein Csm5 [bacterium]
MNKIRPVIRNAYGQPYIPGTSIKGAIRTAIMWNILNWL